MNYQKMNLHQISVFSCLLLAPTATNSFNFDPTLQINLISSDKTIRDPTNPLKCLKAHRFKQVRLVSCPAELTDEYLWGFEQNQVKSELVKDGNFYCWSAIVNKFKTKLKMDVCDEMDDKQKFVFTNGIVQHAGQDIGDFGCFVSNAGKGPLRFKKCTTSRFGKVEASEDDTCDPESVVLKDSAQWQQEEGYWIGEYSLFGSDGNPSTGSYWNYPYDHYKGFITGNVQGNAYRQRNVFMYPPQNPENCLFPNSTGKADGSSPVGVGTCGVNGNTKVFWADQSATTCSNNPELKGDIEGPYGSLSYTYTELIGKDNSLLYQVWLTKAALNYYEAFILGNPYSRCDETGYCGYDEDRLMQSQLTTLTQLPDSSWRRTRTAQGFDAFGNVGAPSYASFYRERKVTEEEFWQEFEQTKTEYNILDSDTCAWKSGDTGGAAQDSGYVAGLEACTEHLNQSFELE